VSHASEQTTLDAITCSEIPVAATHTACRAVFDHARGKSDHALAALGRSGGYIGIVIVPAFLTAAADASLEHLLDHVDHAVNVAGIDAVGIGTDWSAGGYTTDVPKEWVDADPEQDPANQARQLEGLRRLGFRDEHLRNLFTTLDGLRWWREWPNITRGLVCRGYDDDAVRKILGGNWERVFRAAVG
jgi:membrane dipeptidase